MLRQQNIELARVTDAPRIAEMSRDLIEHGLGWSWNRDRVRHAIRNPECNVAVSRHAGKVVAFGIMEYGATSAHLSLFAVDPAQRRKHVGRALLGWLEEVALTAGLEKVNLETRMDNLSGREFYKACGYRVVGRIPGYYFGRESAVRMTHNIRVN